jgi:hypothetical protein
MVNTCPRSLIVFWRSMAHPFISSVRWDTNTKLIFVKQVGSLAASEYFCAVADMRPSEIPDRHSSNTEKLQKATSKRQRWKLWQRF